MPGNTSFRSSPRCSIAKGICGFSLHEVFPGLFLILRDMVSVTKFIFSVSSEGKEGNLDGDKEFVGGGGNFLNFC